MPTGAYRQMAAYWAGSTMSVGGTIWACNRGMRDARDSLGTIYLGMVNQRFTRFIRNVHTPAAWDSVWRRARERARHEWP